MLLLLLLTAFDKECEQILINIDFHASIVNYLKQNSIKRKRMNKEKTIKEEKEVLIVFSNTI